MTTPYIEDKKAEELTEGKYVVRADGSVRVSKDGIHAYMACTCPMEDCEGRAVSAGFFTFTGGLVKVHGESTTLRLKPAPGDAEKVYNELQHLRTGVETN